MENLCSPRTSRDTQFDAALFVSRARRSTALPAILEEPLLEEADMEDAGQIVRDCGAVAAAAAQGGCADEAESPTEARRRERKAQRAEAQKRRRATGMRKRERSRTSEQRE